MSSPLRFTTYRFDFALTEPLSVGDHNALRERLVNAMKDGGLPRGIAYDGRDFALPGAPTLMRTGSVDSHLLDQRRRADGQAG